MSKRIVILGATGSIGQTAIRLLRGDPGFEVVGLSAKSGADALVRDALALGARHVALADEAAARRAAADLPDGMTLHSGPAGLLEMASLGADIVISAIVGMAALPPVLAAIDAGSDVALASKEVMVAAGEAVMRRRMERGVRILPVDSEHSAIFQALQSPAAAPACVRVRGDGMAPAEAAIRRLVLTASGGPFFFRPEVDFDGVTVADALRHPRWSMGPKITIDSATMMNKGLEIIEARWLFDVPQERIGVLVHPESAVHSLVEFTDGAQVAELSVPDMAVPISYALAWPYRAPRMAAGWLDLAAAGALHFHEPDEARFPCLALAREALRRGGTSPAILNAANEVAVQAFLDGRARFGDIWRIAEKTLGGVAATPATDLEAVTAADEEARAFASEAVSRPSWPRRAS